MNRLSYCIVLLLLGSAIVAASCRKIKVDENAQLSFSAEAISFDTIFSTLGSTTQYFTVRNPHNFPLKTTIFLAGGASSYYSINVDGRSGTIFQDIEIPAKDSLFIFVKITINPAQVNNPYLVMDSIVFRSGRVEQNVHLIAYGQDAHFVVANRSSFVKYKTIAGKNQTVHLTNDKPWVIYGYAAVDSLGTLIIDAGTKIYFHRNSGLLVNRFGKLEVNGTFENPVIFRGDLINNSSADKQDFAQWDGIWILESPRDSQIKHAIITNSEVGIRLETIKEWRETGKVFIENCLIKNNEYNGIYIINTEAEIKNTIISHSSTDNPLKIENSSVLCQHVTIGNFVNTKDKSAVALRNYHVANSLVNTVPASGIIVGSTHAQFVNCIIYGRKTSETSIEKHSQSGGTITSRYENCLIKDTVTVNTINCIRNQDPLFQDNSAVDYRLKAGSPAIGAGLPGVCATDYAGKTRNNPPAIGAFEYFSGGAKK